MKDTKRKVYKIIKCYVMKRKCLHYLLITLTFVVTTIFNACKPEQPGENNPQGSVKVTTNSVTNITETSAKCGGSVTATGYSVGTCGVCWSELPNPTTNSYITSDIIGVGDFSSTLSGLESGTEYYVRAYATTSSGTLYGEEKIFTTKENNDGGGNGGDDDEQINHYEYVDLGLPSGLKWATCNIGANSPEDYGDYYAWGETTTKSEYTSDNSLTYGLTYSQLQSQGYVDGEGNLTPSHDAARANWGGSWRMPTENEISELISCCEWESTQVNGVYGSNVTGPNGNSIFLPRAGLCHDSPLDFVGEVGLYWSSTPYKIYNEDAYRLHFSYSNTSINSRGRDIGQSVRPVTE